MTARVVPQLKRLKVMTDQKETRTDRVRYLAEVRDMYDSVYSQPGLGQDPEQYPFETLKDIFMLAACLGFQKGQAKALGDGKKDNFRLEVFSESDQDIMKAIAVAHSSDVGVLSKDPSDAISGEVLTIVEEYANRGIQEIKRLIVEQPGVSIWNLLDLYD